MNDGIIRPSSVAGKLLGFTKSKFDGWLWKTDNRIMISMVISKKPGKGNLSALFKQIESLGFIVAVPTPLGGMLSILKNKGFVQTVEVDKLMGPVEVWVKP